MPEATAETPPDTTPDTPAPSPSPPPYGLRSAVLWTVWLWATVLGLGIGGVAATSGELRTKAAERSAIVLPYAELNETKRREMRSEISEADGIAKVEWISPQLLARRTASPVTRKLWGELLLDDEGWLPWIMLVEFEKPLADPAGVKSTIAGLRKNERIRLILWDQAALDRDSEILRKVQSLAAPIGLLLFGLGAMALFLSPGGSGARGWRGPAFAVLPALAVAIMLLASKVLGAPVGPLSQAAGATTAFILAGVIAPMLIHRANFKGSGATPEK